MGLTIKHRLIDLKIRQRDLLIELRKRGFSQLQESGLSSMINGYYSGPMGDAVLEMAEKILDSYEEKRKD